MSKANHDRAMRDYLSALLTEELEETTTTTLANEPVARLLAQVQPQVQPEQEPEPEPAPEPEPEPAPESEPEPEPEPEFNEQDVHDAEIMAQVAAHAEAHADEEVQPDTSMAEYQEDDFQALFFTVAGLTLAVPLKSLGGIHSLRKPSPLFGKPDWFLGMMTDREDQLQVVDTARWVMPEKYTPELAEKIDYKYLIMLSDSRWGLTCEALVTSTPIRPEDVQWRRTEQGKRPWLAGVVREKMCALVNVDALIAMLDKGLGSQQG